MFKSRYLDFFVLLLVCFVAFWWRLGTLGLIDPDEPFYAQTAREMIATGDWMTPHIYGAPQFEKPIFYFWLVAGSFKALGETEFAGRFPTAIFATALVLLTSAFVTRVWTARAGFLSALVLATGLEFCVMSRLMLTDVPLAFFITGSLFSYWMAAQNEARRNTWIFWSLVFNGLAVLTKGPLGSLITILTTLAFSWWTGRRQLYRGAGFWWGVAAYAAIVVPWYGLMFAEHPRQLWDDFFVRDNFLRVIRAEHPANNHFWYYPGLLLLGSIPWMPAVTLAVRRAIRGLRDDEGALFQWCWLLTSLLFLSIVQSKLPSYAFYLFVPLAVLIGRTLDDVLTHGFASDGERRLVVTLAIVQCALVLGLPFVKAARSFTVPVMMVAGCLAISVVFLLRRQLAPWLLSSAAASLALLGGALTVSLPAVEAESSARPVAAALLRERQPDEALISGKFLVRGIIYYTRLPVFVLANKAQPFWAEHPLPVIVGRKGLRAFIDQHASALSTLRKSDWAWLRNEEVFANREAFAEMGENIVVRARDQTPEKRPASADARN